MDKIRRLSDAIRLGATFRPQCIGHLFRDGKSCALGAAYEAVNNSITGPRKANVLMRRFPALKEKVRHPLTSGITDKLVCVIPSLNDAHRWTRERIADWLESIGL
jgi:hypothetical protein